MSVWPRKNVGGLRLPVSSHAVALAPFSQNSAACGLAGLAHAQLTHMKPPGLFCSVKAAAPDAGTCSRSR